MFYMYLVFASVISHVEHFVATGNVYFAYTGFYVAISWNMTFLLYACNLCTHISMAPVLSNRISFDPWINKLRPRQNDCHFADNIFKYIFMNENA